MAQYINPQELRVIAQTCEVLDEAVVTGKVSFGVIEVFDVNGDTLGFISLGDDLKHSLYAENPGS